MCTTLLRLRTVRPRMMYQNFFVSGNHTPDIGEEVDGWNEDVEDEEGDHLPLVLLLHQVDSEAHSAAPCNRSSTAIIRC